MKKMLPYFIGLIIFSKISVALDLNPINFDADNKRYVLVPLNKIDGNDLEDMFCNQIFNEDKIENYRFYENGQPYSKERAQRCFATKIARCKKWEDGDNTALSWFAVRPEAENYYIGFIGGYLYPDGEFKNKLEICYAKDTYRDDKGLMHAAFVEYFRFYLPALETLYNQDRVISIFAPIHPENERSINWIEKQGFEFIHFDQEKNRNYYFLNFKDLKERHFTEGL